MLCVTPPMLNCLEPVYATFRPTFIFLKAITMPIQKIPGFTVHCRIPRRGLSASLARICQPGFRKNQTAMVIRQQKTSGMAYPTKYPLIAHALRKNALAGGKCAIIYIAQPAPPTVIALVAVRPSYGPSRFLAFQGAHLGPVVGASTFANEVIARLRSRPSHGTDSAPPPPRGTVPVPSLV